ncbi:MAG TPA: type II secretion system minor pseudopilin GspJ [Steroidobacteraceae bacterium]|nr:type II secretion system minor pseudopilin GspJ [Steroidobacteraceae bacterium]
MKRSRGFTLIEIMVAVMIAAILAVMAFGAMREALNHRDLIRTRAARLAALQLAMGSLVKDFTQLQPRPIREPVGDGYQAALIGATAASPEVVFTCGGWTNPAGEQRSTLQRVHYVLRDGVLYRERWLVLDSQLLPGPVSRKLLDGVKDFQLRYMDDSLTWQDSWPPPSTNSNTSGELQLRWRPIAVEVSLTLSDWGTLTRLIEVAG